MSTGFKIPSKTSKKAPFLKPRAFRDEEEKPKERRELISAVDGTSIIAKDGSVVGEEKELIIPVMASTKRKAEDEPDFILEEERKITYGLSVKGGQNKEVVVSSGLRTRIALAKKSAKKDFKSLLKDFPAENDEDFDRVPIEKFGMGALRGMGLKDDEAKMDSAPAVFERRPERLGLGAKPLDIPKKV